MPAAHTDTSKKPTTNELQLCIHASANFCIIKANNSKYETRNSLNKIAANINANTNANTNAKAMHVVPIIVGSASFW